MDDMESRLEIVGERIQAVAESMREAEMLDSVLIIVTYTEGGLTCRKAMSAGNWYASYGAASEYVHENRRVA